MRLFKKKKKEKEETTVNEKLDIRRITKGYYESAKYFAQTTIIARQILSEAVSIAARGGKSFQSSINSESIINEELCIKILNDAGIEVELFETITTNDIEYPFKIKYILNWNVEEED